MVKLLKSLATPTATTATAAINSTAAAKALSASVTDPNIRRNPEQARGRSMIMSVRHAADLLQVGNTHVTDVTANHNFYGCYF